MKETGTSTFATTGYHDDGHHVYVYLDDAKNIAWRQELAARAAAVNAVWTIPPSQHSTRN